jgi:intracellular multiplication protein IcmL
VSSGDKQQKGALSLVFLRNHFYRDQYRSSVIVFLFLLALNALLVTTMIGQMMSSPPPVYFATTATGQIIKWQPLNEPVVQESGVTQFVTDAVMTAFSLDYLHFRAQLQRASAYFTPYGWKTFLAAFKKSNNLTTLVDLKMVSDVKITGAPQVIQKAIVDGRYAWKVSLPVVMTYTGASRTIPMAMKLNLIVLRVPVKDNPNRIAINNFLPVFNA